MNNRISRSKLFLALISIIITFFIWQQGLRESLNRPSVSFDINQKESEIAALALQSIPTNLKKFVVPNDPVKEINTVLSNLSFSELSERNKLIWLLSSDMNKFKSKENFFKDFNNQNYNLSTSLGY